jgi:hypothetical protein
MSTIYNMNRGEPSIEDLLQTIRMMKLKVLKPEDIVLGNGGANLNFARKMIKSSLG